MKSVQCKKNRQCSETSCVVTGSFLHSVPHWSVKKDHKNGPRMNYKSQIDTQTVQRMKLDPLGLSKMFLENMQTSPPHR